MSARSAAAPQARQSIGPFLAPRPLLCLLFLLSLLFRNEKEMVGRVSHTGGFTGGRSPPNGGSPPMAVAPQCFTGGRSPPIDNMSH